MIKTKICTKCGVEKPITEYHTKKHKDKTYLRSECKACGYIQNKKRRNSEAGKEINKIHRTKAKSKYDVAKGIAKRRGIAFNLSFEEFAELTQHDCAYCGGELSKYSYSLDRKDNAKGYEIQNVVPCCIRCNMVKSNILSYEEMVIIGNMLKTLKNKPQGG
jgi:hypothetical protein